MVRLLLKMLEVEVEVFVVVIIRLISQEANVVSAILYLLDLRHGPLILLLQLSS